MHNYSGINFLFLMCSITSIGIPSECFFIKGPRCRILLLFSHIGLFLRYSGPVHYYSKLNAELRDLTIYYGDNSPCGSAGKESPCNEGDLGLIPGLGRSPAKGKGYPLQCSGLKNSMDCIVHGITKSWIWLSDFHTITGIIHIYN